MPFSIRFQYGRKFFASAKPAAYRQHDKKSAERYWRQPVYFLFWGWLTFLAILTQFLLKVVVDYPHHYLVWLAVIPGVIITIVRSGKAHSGNYSTYVGTA
jgi:hypothetical protein